MFNVTARTSGKSFRPRCQNTRIDFALLTPFHSCGNGSPLHGTLTAEPVVIVSSSFSLLNGTRTGSIPGASSFTNASVRPRFRFANFSLDSPPVVRPESEIQISSIVDVVSFLRSRPSRRTFETTRHRERSARVAFDSPSRSRIATVPRKHGM